jgi:hypothetical protein
MTHNEHFLRADDLYEIRHDNNGNAIHVYVKDGDAIVFPTAYDLSMYVINGKDCDRFYISESRLSDMYESNEYNYYILKGIWSDEQEPKAFDLTKFHHRNFGQMMHRMFEEGDVINYEIQYQDGTFNAVVTGHNRVVGHKFFSDVEAKNDIKEAVMQMNLVVR